MKKIIIAVISFLIIVFLIMVITLNLATKKVDNENNYEDLQKKIISNSEWISLSKDDINGYMAKSYTDTMKKVINSLEEAVPVIFRISGGNYTNSSDGAFIIASAFTESNDVYIYFYDFSIKKYVKKTSSLSELLENATNVFICTEPEVLK